MDFLHLSKNEQAQDWCPGLVHAECSGSLSACPGLDPGREGSGVRYYAAFASSSFFFGSVALFTIMRASKYSWKKSGVLTSNSGIIVVGAFSEICSFNSDTINLSFADTIPGIALSGPTFVPLDSSAQYLCTWIGVQDYSWTVIGGQVVSGNGGVYPTIEWTTPGVGSVIVEVSNEGCIVGDTLVVLVGYVGIEEGTATDPTIAINAANEHLIVSGLHDGSSVILSVIDMLGRAVLTHTMAPTNGNAALPLSSLAVGPYNLVVRSGDRMWSKKFVLGR